MSLFDLAALLLFLTAAFGLVNYHVLRLPTAIGLVVVALFASLAVLAFDALVPASTLAERMRDIVGEVDFRATLKEGMLSFLLFAGALHLDFGDLRRERGPVIVLATVGVVTSTLLVALGLHLLTGLPFAYALVFGALISPTDPVAVVGIMRLAGAPKHLETRIVGERVLGGLALGAAAGWLTFLLLKRVDEHTLEITLTLALVTGVYALAEWLHVSGPLAVVAAGLFIGNTGVRLGMSERTRQYMLTFWTLLDEILNALLFLLIGLEVFAIRFEAGHAATALVAVPLVLAARLFSIAVPAAVVAPWRGFDRRAVAVLTWGGLRGGISVALALSLPDDALRPVLLTATYAVVIFSIVVQGLTIRPLVERLADRPPPIRPHPDGPCDGGERASS